MENPCNTCPDREFCDYWEMSYCCDWCKWFHEKNESEPDCEHCDPMDI